MSPYRIILADDQPEFRQLLKRVLVSNREMQVVGEVDDGHALLSLLHRSLVAPDLVIMDVSMPKLPGIAAAREVKGRYPGIKVLILTIHKELRYVNEAFTAGASGYLNKDEAESELLKAIDVIRQGQIYKPAPVAE